MGREVVALWRYPVKSLLGEPVAGLDVDERGVAGDRRWALVDPDGGIASGKRTRRFRRVPGLLRHRSRLGADGTPVVELADGRLEAPSDALAEELAGPGWRFAEERDVPHLDAGPVHLVTTATLASLSAHAGEPVEPERLRPNLLVDAGDDREEGWAGRRLRIGGAVLEVTVPVERCVMVNLAHGPLAPRPRLLKEIEAWNGLHAGMYARTLSPGRIRAGDAIALL